MKLKLNQVLRRAQALARQGAHGEAEEIYKKILASYPANKRALSGLKELQTTARQKPSDRNVAQPSQAIINELSLFFQQGRFVEVAARAEELVRMFPDAAVGYNILGLTHARTGKVEAAIDAFRKSLRINSNDASSHYNLGNALKESGKSAESISAYREAIRLKPDYGDAWRNMAIALTDGFDMDAAIAAFEKALVFSPEAAASIHYGIGKALLGKGDVAWGVDAFRKALEIKPDYIECILELSILGDDGCHDSLSEKVEHILEGKSLSAESYVYALFAKANLEMQRGDKSKAICVLNEAGRQRKKLINYDVEQDVADFKRIAARYSDNIASLKSSQSAVVPIFILGMPRSGTSLVEQILASHSMVFGAGELMALREAVEAAGGDDRIVGDGDAMKAVRENYLSSLSALPSAGRKYITDKLPLNFKRIGHIATCLPEAKIIHLIRDPRAVCWSNYKTYFHSPGMAFTFDQVDVARYHKLYESLMQFWRERFPGLIFDLDYEALTEGPEGEVRRLLDHIGLPWEDSVLEFHKNMRPVKTASRTQVRQKIYKGSSDSWRSYEAWLAPMLSALNQDPPSLV